MSKIITFYIHSACVLCNRTSFECTYTYRLWASIRGDRAVGRRARMSSSSCRTTFTAVYVVVIVVAASVAAAYARRSKHFFYLALPANLFALICFFFIDLLETYILFIYLFKPLLMMMMMIVVTGDESTDASQAASDDGKTMQFYTKHSQVWVKRVKFMSHYYCVSNQFFTVLHYACSCAFWYCLECSECLLWKISRLKILYIPMIVKQS